MTREELHTFAAAGVAQKIATIERELAVYHKEWPELFLSATVPQLLKPVLKNGHSSNGTHAAIDAPPSSKQSKQIASWTPARRAKQARIMRRRQKAMQAAKAAKRAVAGKVTRTHSAATRRKLALAMKRRHASGEIARAKAAARDN
jgi:hypothetical protein